jgi:hypothetical protein
VPTALVSGNSAVSLLLLFPIAGITTSAAAPSPPATCESKGPRKVKIPCLLTYKITILSITLSNLVCDVWSNEDTLDMSASSSPTECHSRLPRPALLAEKQKTLFELPVSM